MTSNLSLQTANDIKQTQAKGSSCVRPAIAYNYADLFTEHSS